jgi:hypothetical protein
MSATAALIHGPGAIGYHRGRGTNGFPWPASGFILTQAIGRGASGHVRVHAGQHLLTGRISEWGRGGRLKSLQPLQSPTFVGCAPKLKPHNLWGGQGEPDRAKQEPLRSILRP